MPQGAGRWVRETATVTLSKALTTEGAENAETLMWVGVVRGSVPTFGTVAPIQPDPLSCLCVLCVLCGEVLDSCVEPPGRTASGQGNSRSKLPPRIDC
jgi:hypothetical protein